MRVGKHINRGTYQLNPQMTARLEAIDWFSRCGQPDRLELDMPAQYLSSWEQAKKYYHAQEWEDTTLEANNVLTRYLSFHHRQEYHKWNPITDVAKSFMQANLEPKWIAFQAQQGLDKAFIGNIQWDILAAMMEDAYTYCNPPIHFFSELLAVYEAGHFPCGWEAGEWPNGRLVVL